MQTFFKTYYAPNNAALAIVGDFDPAEAKKFVEKYFGGIKSAELPPQPDLTEPRQEKEKHATKKDALATKPALALGYHMPERNTPEYYAMGLIEQMLIEGNDSVLYKELVQKRGIHRQRGRRHQSAGHTFNYNGPMLFITDLIHDPATKRRRRSCKPWTRPSSRCALSRWIRKCWIARWSSCVPICTTRSAARADLDWSTCWPVSRLFDDNPARVNSLVAEYEKVTPALIQKTAQEYLAS